MCMQMLQCQSYPFFFTWNLVCKIVSKCQTEHGRPYNISRGYTEHGMPCKYSQGHM